VVERRAGRYVGRHVGDVHPGAHAVALAPEAEGVVEVLRPLGVDGEGEEVAEVDAIRLKLAGRLGDGRRRPPNSLVPEQALENRLDVVRSPERQFHPRAATAESQDGQVADGRVSGALAIDDDGRAGVEERFADEELPAPGELGDQEVQATRRGA
jgi:hypothetical protein